MRKTWAFREVGEGGQGSVGQIFDQAYLLLSFTHTAPINNMHSFVFV